MDELIERAKEHIRSYGYNGFADHTVMPSLMAEFAKIYHDSEVKKLNIPAVSGRSEQLLAFAQWLKDETLSGLMATPKYYVERYEKANNCH